MGKRLDLFRHAFTTMSLPLAVALTVFAIMIVMILVLV